MRKNILFFALGLIIAGSIGVYATIRIQADEIGYKDGTVEEALNDLYVTSQTSATRICKYESNEYGDSNNHYSLGTEYVCDVNLDGTTKYNFYILNVTGDTVTLIMKHNIFEGSSKTTYYWNEALNYVYSINWRIRADLPRVQDIANAVNYTSWNYTAASTSNKFYLDSHTTTGNKNATNPSDYQWLFNYSMDCASYGCKYNFDLNYTNSNGVVEAGGYWTRDVASDGSSPSRAWRIGGHGDVCADVLTNNERGVRPVITVLKSNLYE